MRHHEPACAAARGKSPRLSTFRPAPEGVAADGAGRTAAWGSSLILPLSHNFQFSIRTSFKRPEAPLLIDTADLAQPKRSATSATSSAFALPSTGGDFTRAVHGPPPCGSSSALTLERGLTLTSMVLA